MPPWNESIEAMLMILPGDLRATSSAAKRWLRRKAPFRLTLSTSVQSASENSSRFARRMMPALLTRMSARPKAA